MITIGTRGSKLALWQANYVLEKLQEIQIPAALKIIKTQGDKFQHLSFDKLEGKGFFTKEIETALLQHEIDLAVHSLKDLPTISTEGLAVAGVSYRENPADWLIIRKNCTDKEQLLNLKTEAIVGTSSARRKAQLRNLRPDIQLKDIRGNVPTRLQKLREAQFDAIALAAAGVTRLEIDLSEFDVLKFSPKEFVPAPAQGVLGFQIRAKDTEMRSILKRIHHPEVSRLTNVERKILRLFDGGCHLPMGAYCQQDKMGNFHVWAVKANDWDAPLHKVQYSSSTTDGLAETVFNMLNAETGMSETQDLNQ